MPWMELGKQTTRSEFPKHSESDKRTPKTIALVLPCVPQPCRPVPHQATSATPSVEDDNLWMRL